MSPPATEPWVPRRGRFGRYAPLPFVTAAVVLIALLVFTPVLFSSGTSILLAQGELIVDAVPSANWTKLYVEPLDTQAVRYDAIALDLGYGFLWNGTCPSSVPNWTNVSETHAIDLSANTTHAPVLVWAEATYAGRDGPVVFAGAFAFNLEGPAGPNAQLGLAACPLLTPGVSVPESSIAVDDLQLTLSLVNFGSGGPP